MKNLRIIIITLGLFSLKSVMLFHFILSLLLLTWMKPTNVENQQHLDEQERNLQILIDEMNDYIREVLAQIS